MRLYFLFLLFLFCFSDTRAQESRSPLDSLRQLVSNADSDLNLANGYLNLADYFKYRNQDSTLKYAELVKSTISVASSPTLIAQAYDLEAGNYFLRGEYKKVIEVAQLGLEAIANETEMDKMRADLIRLIGVSYGSSGNYELSLTYFLETKQLYESIGDSASVITTLNNIGVIYLKLNNFDEALKIFLELQSVADFNKPDNVTIPVNLGFIYYELEEFEKAEEQLQRALDYDGEVDQRAYGLSYFKLGEVYQQKKNYQKAIDAFKASIEVYVEMNNELEQVQSLNGLARVYLNLDELIRAENYAHEALKISNQFAGLPEKKVSLETLYLISKQKNEPSSALNYFEQLQQVSDSLQNAEITAEIARLTAEYDYNQKENKLLLQQKEQELKSQAQINKQKLLLLGSGIFLLLTLALLFFMYRNNLHKKETNKLLSQKNTEIQDKAEKLEQSNSVKNRLFSILAHDLRGPLSSLYGAFTLIEANASKEELAEIIPSVSERFKYTSTLLNNLLQWSQSQMEGYKVISTSFDFIELLKEKKMLLQFKLDEKKLDLIIPSGEYFVCADRNMMDLVVQNLVSNALKYSTEGNKIEISILDRDGKAQVSIKDYGIGIEQDKIEKIFSDEFYTTKGTYEEKGTGLGLMLCRDFIERNDGNIWVESQVGFGSTFHLTIPHP